MHRPYIMHDHHASIYVQTFFSTLPTPYSYNMTSLFVDKLLLLCTLLVTPCIGKPHLSKGPSDLKQNGTQAKKPFSGPFFMAFHMV